MPEVLLREAISTPNGVHFRSGSRLYISREFFTRDGSQKFLQLAYANGSVVLTAVREDAVDRVDPRP